MTLSEDALEYMTDLARQCVANGYANIRGMRFDGGKSGAVHNELKELGLIELKGTKGASWALTEAGKDWVMENRDLG